MGEVWEGPRHAAPCTRLDVPWPLGVVAVALLLGSIGFAACHPSPGHPDRTAVHTALVSAPGATPADVADTHPEPITDADRAAAMSQKPGCSLINGTVPPDLPPAGNGTCCIGAASLGPSRCTCWTAVYDLEHGSIFVVLADKYSDRADGGPSSARSGRGDRAEVFPPGRSTTGMAPRKSVLCLPERYRIGCIDDLGLIARAKIIWSKPSGMPESVTDRVRVSHEDIVHLTKREQYYSAVDEIREPFAAPQRTPGANSFGGRNANHLRTATGPYDGPTAVGALPGSVWTITSRPFIPPAHIAHARCCGGRDKNCDKGLSHFATYPPALVRRIVLGWTPPGICTVCDEGRAPVADRTEKALHRPSGAKNIGRDMGGDGRPREKGYTGNVRTVHRITGYACACPEPTAPTRPAVIVDPFGGTGTTALVASVHGRVGISCDLSHDYGRLAQWRSTDPGERARALGAPKPPPVSPDQGSLFEEGIA